MGGEQVNSERGKVPEPTRSHREDPHPSHWQQLSLCWRPIQSQRLCRTELGPESQWKPMELQKRSYMMTSGCTSQYMICCILNQLKFLCHFQGPHIEHITAIKLGNDWAWVTVARSFSSRGNVRKELELQLGLPRVAHLQHNIVQFRKERIMCFSCTLKLALILLVAGHKTLATSIANFLPLRIFLVL